MSDEQQQSTVVSTPTASEVSLQQQQQTSSPLAQGVNTAQTHSNPQNPQFDITNAQMQHMQSRINNLMSEKDKALNERNQTIAALNDLQNKFNALQAQYDSNMTTAVQNAQQAIDRANGLEQQLGTVTARSAKYAALMQKPHLAPYAALIPEHGDETKLQEVIMQLEQIREEDLKRSLPPQTALSQGNSLSSNISPPQSQPPSLLTQLYGNRANMNPQVLAQFNQTPIGQQGQQAGTSNASQPGSSPAQMNPAAMTDIPAQVQALFDEAYRIGTDAAFKDATQRAALLANAAYGQNR